MGHHCPRLARRIKCRRNFCSGSFPAITVRRAKDPQLGLTIQFGQSGRGVLPLLPVQKFERNRLIEYFALNRWHTEVGDDLRENGAVLIKGHFSLLLNRFLVLNNTVKRENRILIVIYDILHLPLLFGCPSLGHFSFLLQLFVSLLTSQMVLQ